MEYVSDKLCHFVGKSLPSDEERFDLLIKIIKSGKLIANLQEPNRPQIIASSRYEGNRVGEVYEKTDCVCFCDIPDDALEIHTNKYGKFGIGFNKHDVALQGAHPVMYIPMNCAIKEISETNLPKDPIKYFNLLTKEYTNLMNFLVMVNQCVMPFKEPLLRLINSELAPYIGLLDSDVINAIQNNKSHQLIYSQLMAFTGILAYIKLFDETLSPDDEENFYMEREWRILNSLNFNSDNVKIIYLPNKDYVELFKVKIPEYNGEFHIFNE